MITKNNLADLLDELTHTEKIEVLESDCEYVVLSADFLNAGVVVTFKCLDDLPGTIEELTAGGNTVVLNRADVLTDLGIGGELTEEELYNMYDEDLDNIYDDINVAGMEYPTSEILKKVDNVAYRCGFNDWLDSRVRDEQILEQNNKYYSLNN